MNGSSFSIQNVNNFSKGYFKFLNLFQIFIYQMKIRIVMRLRKLLKEKQLSEIFIFIFYLHKTF